MKCLCCIFLTFLLLIVVVPIVLFIGFYKPRSFGTHPRHVDHVINGTTNSTTFSPVTLSLIESITAENDESGVELVEGTMNGAEEPVEKIDEENIKSEKGDKRNDFQEEPSKRLKETESISVKAAQPMKTEKEEKMKEKESTEIIEEEVEEVVMKKKKNTNATTTTSSPQNNDN